MIVWPLLRECLNVLFISIRSMDKFTGFFNFILDHDIPEDFVVSQWQSKHKNVYYVIYRWIIAIFYIFSISMSALEDFNRGTFSTHFIYFTNINLNLSMIMTVWSALLATRYYSGKLKFNGKMTKTLKCFWMLSSTTVASSCLASFTYWSKIHNPEIYPIDLCNILVHATNSLVLLIDMCIVRQPARYSTIIFPIINAIGYLTFTWLYPALGGLNRLARNEIKTRLYFSERDFKCFLHFDRFNENFIYHILNWNEETKDSMIVGASLIFFLAVFHVMITLIQKTRLFVYRKLNLNEWRRTNNNLEF